MLQALIPLAIGGASIYGQKKAQEYRQDRMRAAGEVVFKMMQGEEATDEDRQLLSSLDREDLVQAANLAEVFSKSIEARQAKEPIPEGIRGQFPNIPESTTYGQLETMPSGILTHLLKETPEQEWRGSIEKRGGTVLERPGLPGRAATPTDALLSKLLPEQIVSGPPGSNLLGAMGEAPEEGMFYTGTGELKTKPTPETKPVRLIKWWDQTGKMRSKLVKDVNYNQEISRILTEGGRLDEAKTALTPSEANTEKQRQRQFVLTLYGENEWNKLESDVAQRALTVINRADELMKKDPAMSFNKAAQIAFNEDPENVKTAVLKKYPEAYQGEDGQWYIDKGDKTFRIKPK